MGSRHMAEIAYSRCGLSDRFSPESFVDGMPSAIEFLMVGLLFIVQNRSNAENAPRRFSFLYRTTGFFTGQELSVTGCGLCGFVSMFSLPAFPFDFAFALPFAFDPVSSFLSCRTRVGIRLRLRLNIGIRLRRHIIPMGNLKSVTSHRQRPRSRSYHIDGNLVSKFEAKVKGNAARQETEMKP
jgi:hypothetical protein